MKTFCILTILALVPLTAAQQPTVAQATLYSRSASLAPAARTVPGFGVVTTYFTTSDGLNSLPLQTTVEGLTYFSGELRPESSSSYIVDYLTHSSALAGYIGYGQIQVSIPIADADGNTVPDFLQRENRVNLSITGTQILNHPQTLTAALSGTLSRDPGQTTGRYSVTVLGETTSGVWAVLQPTGTFTYHPNKTHQISLTWSGIDGSTRSATGGGLYSIRNGSLALEPFTLTGNGESYSTRSTTLLTRQGLVFRGPLTVADGAPKTHWPDFTAFQVEITDVDSDRDGLPDLVDPNIPRPTFTQVVRRQNGALLLTARVSNGYNFAVQFSLDGRVWSSVDRVIATGDNMTFSMPAGGKAGFYRLMLEL